MDLCNASVSGPLRASQKFAPTTIHTPAYAMLIENIESRFTKQANRIANLFVQSLSFTTDDCCVT